MAKGQKPSIGGGTKASTRPPEKVGPVKFVAQTRQEAAKVTWTTWKETWTTTIMVFIVVALFGAFFLLTDGVLSTLTKYALTFGGAQ
ncbi:preprotein translocase subunit SecE [Robiginitomaculum antarcticum]|uniref:preprotein translocase subunit SecE n=1 Tax=Robiginitomaculum antarcticum TaxID=437507 RepID=UPI0003817FA2|nr:preprotein translocase subunit SecE [Robiginitomaculum antarcticum]